MTMMPPFRLHWVVCGTFHPLNWASDSLQDVKQVDGRDHDEGAADGDHDEGGGDRDHGGCGIGGAMMMLLMMMLMINDDDVTHSRM